MYDISSAVPVICPDYSGYTFLDVTASGITLGFIINRVGCGFLFVEQSFLFIVTIVTLRNYHYSGNLGGQTRVCHYW